MIHKGVSRTFFLYAYIFSDGSPKTGDALNITVYKAEDTGASVQVTDTITEIDSVNMPGWYRFTTILNGNSVALSAKSATSGVLVHVAGVYLNSGSIPTASAGTSGGLPVIGGAPLDTLSAVSGSVVSDASNTDKLFKTDITGSASAYIGTFLTFSSGTNNLVTREVIGFTTGGFIEVNRPFPSVPAPGDTFRLIGYSGR